MGCDLRLSCLVVASLRGAAVGPRALFAGCLVLVICVLGLVLIVILVVCVAVVICLIVLWLVCGF